MYDCQYIAQTVVSVQFGAVASIQVKIHTPFLSLTPSLSLNLLSFPLSPLLYPTSHFPPIPLKVGPLKSSAISSPSEVWGRAPAEIEFGVFYPSKMTVGVNNFNDISEIQLTK